MPLSNAERQKRWRSKQKEANLEEYRRKERERQRRIYVPHSELPAAQLKERRRKDREKSSKRYNKKKVHEVTASTSARVTRSNNEKLIVKMPKQKQNKTVGVQKRYRRALRVAYRKISVLSDKNLELEKSKKKLQKRTQRLVLKYKHDSTAKSSMSSIVSSSECEQEHSSTPKSKTKLLLKKAGIKFNPKKNVHRQLLLGNALIESMKDILKSRKKTNVKQMASGIIKKYRCINALSRQVGVSRRKIASVNEKRVCQSIKEKYGEKVMAFFEREDNSTTLPGKRDKKTTNKEVKQKVVLNDYLHNLHEKFQLENTDIKISRSEFSKLREPHVLLTSYSSRKTCLCTYHQNFALKIKTMRREGIECSANPDVFIKEYASNEMCASVLDQKLDERKEIKYLHWKKVQDADKYRWKEIEETTSKKAFIDLVLSELTTFREHVHRVQNQYREMRRLRENLPEHDVLVWMDFAENYGCSSMEEVQSAYWNAAMVSLHTMVVYFPEGSGKHIQSYIAVSDSLTHNAPTVYCILQKLIPILKEECPGLKRIHYLTDSPTSQYRNKTMFQAVCHHEEDFGVSARWNYLEVGHGKGPCDGLGASAKRAADNAVKQQVSVQSASDFYQWATASTASKVKYILYTETDIEEAQELISKKEPPLAVQGTMKIHAVVPIDSRTIATRQLSCNCNSCLSDVTNTECTGWVVKPIVKDNKSLTTASKAAVGNHRPVVKPTDNSSKATATDIIPEPRGSQLGHGTSSIHSGEWIAAVYDDAWFVGQVTDTDSDDLQVNFLVKSGKYGSAYKFPMTRDEIWINRQDILTVVKTLTSVGKTRRCYKLDSAEMEMIEEKFQKHIQ